MSGFTTIADACELVTDGTHYTPKDVGTGLPFLTVKDVSASGLDFSGCSFISESDYLVAKAGNSAPMQGDVLFSKDGTVGKVHVVSTDQPFAVLSSLAILRPTAGKVDPDYLGHVLRSPAVLDDALKKKTGSAIRRIVLGDLKRVRLPLPPLKEQRRIAAILDQAETVRCQRRAALAQLDSLTQSIFLDMFGDPVVNMKGLPVCFLGDLCTRITDGTHQSPKWEVAGIPFLFISNIVDGLITFDTHKFISTETHLELTRRCPIEIGDVLYTTVGSYGNAAIVDTSDRFAFQRHIAHIKPDVTKANSIFIAAMIQSIGVRRQVDKVAKGVAQKTVNLADLKSLLVFAPPLPLQQTFATRIQAIESLKTTHRSALAELDALFASLQQRAFAGEL